MLEILVTQNTPLLQCLPGPLKPRVLAPDSILSIGQTELFDMWTECKQTTNAKPNWEK